MFSYVGCAQNFLLFFSLLVLFSNAADIQIKICNTFKIDKYKNIEIIRERELWNLIYEFSFVDIVLARRYMTKLSALGT